MRVTQQMLMESGASDLSQAIRRVLDLQGQLSSGRKLRKPSDDPTGIPRAMSYRTTLAVIEQYQSNAAWGESQMATADQSLGSANTLLVRARELAIALSNDDFDATARQAAATEVDGILDQLLQLANTETEGRFLFSGHETRTQALVASATGIVYQGDQGALYSKIESASKVQVNLLASDIYLASLTSLGKGFDLNRGIDSTVLLSDLHLGNGIDQTPGTLDFTDVASGTTVTVDLSGATTINDVLNEINTQLAGGGIAGVTASVSPTGNGLRIDATPNGIVSTATTLSQLNSGNGIELIPGTLHVFDGSGAIDVEVDLSGSSTISDVITAFNTQMTNAGVANVTMSVNAGQTGLQIEDTNGSPLGLTIEDYNEQHTAQDLGLVGAVNAQLVGSDLNPERIISINEAAAGQTTAADLGILGTVNERFDGADLDPAITLLTPLSQLDNAHGLSLGDIRIAQGDESRIVNLSSLSTVGDVIDAINATGLAVTASIGSNGRGIEVVSTDSTRSLMITDFDATGSAGVLGIAGSPDIMGTMMLLVDALRTDDRAMVGNLIGTLTDGSNHLLDQRASVGSRIRRLQSTTDRLADITLLFRGLSSEVEDADIVDVTTKLATQQNVYQAALNAVARSLQISLVDFIR